MKALVFPSLSCSGFPTSLEGTSLALQFVTEASVVSEMMREKPILELEKQYGMWLEVNISSA